MTHAFLAGGTYARVAGEWLPTSASMPRDDEGVTIFVRDRAVFEAWRPDGEVSRSWPGQVGRVVLEQRTVEEIVKVLQYARYRGVEVMLDGVADGLQTVLLVSNDRHVAAELKFDGDERFDGFRKRIAPEELTDLRDEVTVRWRRGVGRVS